MTDPTGAPIPRAQLPLVRAVTAGETVHDMELVVRRGGEQRTILASAKPILDRTSFVKTTMVRTYFIDQPERLLLDTAMLGVVVTYLTDQIPQNVTVTWNLFSDRIQKVPTVAEDPAGPFPSIFWRISQGA